jgi:hypothetical protein
MFASVANTATQSNPLIHLSSNLLAPLRPRLLCMLLDAALDLFLKLDLVPVIVECDDRVDRITEFGYQEQRVDGVDYVLGRRVSGPVAVEDGMTDATVATDVWVID